MSIKYLCGLFNTLSAGILTELTKEKLCFIFQFILVPVHCSFSTLNLRMAFLKV